MTYKIGIIGKGFVGGAIYENFKNYFSVEVYDTDSNKKTLEFDQLVNWAEILFVCVPTPMKLSDNSCDTSIVESVIKQIAEVNKNKIVVIKSTVPPGTTTRLSKETGMAMCFNPEFLTEANYIEDFKHQPLIVIGSEDSGVCDAVYDLYCDFNSKVQSQSIIKFCKSDEAEMFKYLANCFLATKVTFLNEMYRLCQTVGINYNAVADIAKTDRRLGYTHWKVPGPDGKFGFGGSCFPKDMNALSRFADNSGSTLWLISEALYINEDIRK